MLSLQRVQKICNFLQVKSESVQGWKRNYTWQPFERAQSISTQIEMSCPLVHKNKAPSLSGPVERCWSYKTPRRNCDFGGVKVELVPLAILVLSDITKPCNICYV